MEGDALIRELLSLRESPLQASVPRDVFLEREARRMSSPPSPRSCCALIERHAVFDALNETLELLSAPPIQTPTTKRLNALKRGLCDPRPPPPAPIEEEMVLRSLREDHLRLERGEGESQRAEDIGKVVRSLWERKLREVWREPSEEELLVGGEGEEEEDIEEEDEAARQQERLQRARVEWWGWREREILTEDELHGALWQALHDSVSPPFPQEGEEGEQEKQPSLGSAGRLSMACGSEADGGGGREGDGERGNGRMGGKEGDGSGVRRGVSHVWIHYDDWTRVLDELEASGFGRQKLSPLRSARAFLSLNRDTYGRVSILSLYSLACSVSQLLQTRFMLALVDEGSGRLGEPAVESFVGDLIPKLSHLRDHPHLQPTHSFLPFYVAHATRLLTLLLDPKRRGSVAVEELLLSPQLGSLFALGSPLALPKEVEEGNWFSLPSAIRIYRQFLSLDLDHDGMLTAEELLGYGQPETALTPAFVGRLFEVAHTYDGKLDYKGYLDFVIASENKPHPAAIGYFFRALDLNSTVPSPPSPPFSSQPSFALYNHSCLALPLPLPPSSLHVQ